MSSSLALSDFSLLPGRATLQTKVSSAIKSEQTRRARRGIFAVPSASGNTITGNLISGNGHFGVLLHAGNVTGGNRIGISANGSAAIPNGGSPTPDDGLAGTNARGRVHRRFK